jgi:hypothetical protein
MTNDRGGVGAGLLCGSATKLTVDPSCLVTERARDAANTTRHYMMLFNVSEAVYGGSIDFDLVSDICLRKILQLEISYCTLP